MECLCLFYNCWLQFGSIQLAHCLCDTTGKQKNRLPLQRYGGGSQVSELSSFSLFESSCFFLVLALYLNELLYPGNVHGNLPSVVSSSCYRISLFYSQSTINKIINFTSTDWKIKAA